MTEHNKYDIFISHRRVGVVQYALGSMKMIFLGRLFINYPK